MEITVNDLYELKLLVECVDIEQISASFEGADGFGTAGVGIIDVVNNPSNVLPVSGVGMPGSIISSEDCFIVTQSPKAFAWFSKILLHSRFQGLSPVACWELLPSLHLAYCALHSKNEDYDIKEELLFICDMLIKRAEQYEKAGRQQKLFKD